MFKLLYIVGGFIAGKLYVEHKSAIKAKLAGKPVVGKIADMAL
jgi:hypothetical protein